MGLVLAAGVAVQLAGQQRTFIGARTCAPWTSTSPAADGLPLTDLKPEEVQLKLDGKTRKVINVKLIEVAPARRAPPEPRPSRPCRSPSPATPAPNQGRMVIIAIDDESFRVGTRASDARRRLGLPRQRSTPRDQVGLVTMPHGGWKVHPTTDRQRVKEAMARHHRPRRSSPRAADEVACRTRGRRSKC